MSGQDRTSCLSPAIPSTFARYMVRPQPFVTPPHHLHITLSLYLFLSLWPSKGLGYTSIQILLHSSRFVSHLHRSSSAWLGRPLPALLALAGTHICLRSCLLNIILYLYSISTPIHFQHPLGPQVPLAALVHIQSSFTERVSDTLVSSIYLLLFAYRNSLLRRF